MTKHSIKKSKKHNNNRILRWDPSEREEDFKWIREFQKKIQNTFPTKKVIKRLLLFGATVQ